jgi:hypothetical protein
MKFAKPTNSAGALAVAAANGFRQCVVRAMGEGVAVDHEQRATRECELTNSRRTPFPSCPIAGPMGRSLRFRRRGRPCRNRQSSCHSNLAQTHSLIAVSAVRPETAGFKKMFLLQRSRRFRRAARRASLNWQVKCERNRNANGSRRGVKIRLTFECKVLIARFTKSGDTILG